MRYRQWNTLLAMIAVISIAAAFLPSIISQEYMKYSKLPDVDVKIVPMANGNLSNTLFSITNKGYGPATNISYVIYSTNKILELFNNFSTTKIINPAINNTLDINDKLIVNSNSIELFVPKLVPAYGSKVNIMAIIDLKDYDIHKNTFYSVASYDQGITEGTLLNELRYGHMDIYLIVYYLFLILFVFVFLIMYLKRRDRHHKTAHIINTVINLRKMASNQNSHSSFKEQYSYLKRNNSFIPEVTKDWEIRTFFETLDERENLLSSYELQKSKLIKELDKIKDNNDDTKANEQKKNELMSQQKKLEVEYTYNLKKINKKLLGFANDIWTMDKIGSFE